MSSNFEIIKAFWFLESSIIVTAMTLNLGLRCCKDGNFNQQQSMVATGTRKNR